MGRRIHTNLHRNGAMVSGGENIMGMEIQTEELALSSPLGRVYYPHASKTGHNFQMYWHGGFLVLLFAVIEHREITKPHVQNESSSASMKH